MPYTVANLSCVGEFTKSFSFRIHPLPPYDFNLTVRKPAGWSLFTPYEIYGENVIWTASIVRGTLTGLRISSIGTVESPEIEVDVYSRSGARIDNSGIADDIRYALGANHDLKHFYTAVKNDSILQHVISDLYGMHDTFPTTLFPDAILAILLQMAPLKRSNEMMSCFIREFGELVRFDGKEVYAWPEPMKISSVHESELAEKCKVGYRAKSIVKLSRKLTEEDFPAIMEMRDMDPAVAKKLITTLPGIGDYSSDIINPHGGFPIDVWSAEVFGKLFFGHKPENNREAVKAVKEEGMRRWGKWAWMAFFYVVNDLPNLSEKLGVSLRLS